VLFDRICLNNGIRHLLTAPLFADDRRQDRGLAQDHAQGVLLREIFETIEQCQASLDLWVVDYNNDREHQSLGDMPPIRPFELATPASLEIIDGDSAIEQTPPPRPKTVSRRVDQAGRISILKHRYHVGRHLTEAVTIESTDGLLHVSHNGVVVRDPCAPASQR
jgi:hypothetical protein